MQDGEKTEKKKKVGFIITKGVWGGAQKYVYQLATNLPKQKYDVFVIAGEGEALKNKLIEKDIKTYTLKNLKRDISVIAEIKSFFVLLKIIWKEKPDVLHLNSPKAGGLGGLVGRILFIKKIIYTSHGWTFNENRPEYQNIIIWFLAWITVLLSHKTIVIAPQEKESIKKLPLIKDSKIFMIRNGVENIRFKEKQTAQKDIVKRLDIKTHTEETWIGTIAELHKNKGLEYAIEALSKVNHPFKYFILGEGEERAKLEKMIRKYNLESKVFLVGFVDKAKEYLKAFDIFMLTSIKEGLPYTILEAGMAELGVIASSVGGIPDIIENGVSGILTTKGRVGEITRSIEYIIDKPEERKEFGLKLKERIEKDFSLSQMVKRTLELYGK
ncbi:MAG: glycosyltransferase family 4 protein [Parcubacteria group bacterium]